MIVAPSRSAPLPLLVFTELAVARKGTDRRDVEISVPRVAPAYLLGRLRGAVRRRRALAG